ncbi:MAG: 3-isopropylmalate dehydrogenase [Dehalococcoidia bacterium]|nr:3-isopropylmalate dehydrogenase [Dehalococcoidia bacterium]
MNFDIAVLPGDGVGPDVTNEARRVLDDVGNRFGHRFTYKQGYIGGISIDKFGSALPQATINICRRCDAVLLGAVGGPKWDNPEAITRPEDGLLAIRKELGLFANLRPVKMFKVLQDSTSLKPEVVARVDLMVVRELTGGLYFGRPKRRWSTSRGRRAVDSMVYTEKEIERILRVGFELALSRRRKLTSVDKANVLESSRLWRQIAGEMAAEYPKVTVDNMLVDACAMRLIRDPAYFDVIVTENMFGDILTDEASMLAGSMGMLPSASLAEIPGGKSSSAFGLYEPIHGSAPDIAGRNLANPIAAILSAAMMLHYSLGLGKEAATVEQAVLKVLDEGYRTKDIMTAGMKQTGTQEMGKTIAYKIKQGI